MKINIFQVGDHCKDTITGFSGVAVARTEWLNGCVRITVQPTKLTKDGGVQSCETFDENQLELLPGRTTKRGNDKPGGPRPEPVRYRDPR